MRTSLRGHQLPESLAEFQQLGMARLLKHEHCFRCRSVFPEKTHSPEGWRDTQITGMCEDCFDTISKEPT